MSDYDMHLGRRSRVHFSGHTNAEELANVLTHGLGVVMSLIALPIMIWQAAMQGDPYKIVSVSIFGATMLLLYSASTIYHVVRHPGRKYRLRVVDHIAIYFLIAGTYTPFTLVAIRGAWGWSLFGVAWGLAVAGIIFKLFLTGRLQALSLGIYLGMGWLGVIAVKPVLEALPTAGVIWVVAGGLMYTLGVIFYAWRKIPHHHAVWHLFVLGGTLCHFVAIFWYVLPPTAT